MKFSTVLKLVPYYIIIVMVLLYFSITNLMGCSKSEKVILEKQYKYLTLAQEFQTYSDYLSRLMFAYILTGDPDFEEEYLNDIGLDYTNKRIVNELYNLGLDSFSEGHAIKILNTSKEIHNMETQFLKENEELLEKDVYDLFTDNEYLKLKKDLSQYIAEFNNYIITMSSDLSTDAYAKTNKALGFLIAVVMLSMTTLCALFYYYKVKLNTINGLVDNVVKIADGDFDVDLSEFQSKDEFGILAGSFSKMIDAVMGIIYNIDFIAEQHDLGNTSVMLNPDDFKGSYKEVALGINDLLNSYNEMNALIYELLNDIATGNLDISIPEFSGDRKIISEAGNDARNNILRIYDEINVLIKKTSSGVLVNDVPNHDLQGKWKEILESIYLLPTTIFNELIEVAPIAYLVVKNQNSEIISANKFAREKVNINLPGNVDMFNERIYKQYTLSGRKAMESELIPVVMRDGTTRRFSVHISKIANNDVYADVIWAFDVEEREANRDSLENSVDNMEVILEAIHVPIVIFADDGMTVIYTNKAYREKMLISTEDLEKGLTRYRYLPETQADGTSSKEALKELTDRVFKENKEFFGELRYKKTNGEEFDAQITTIKIIYFGQPAGLTVIQDITAEKIQRELLESAAEKEREANNLKSHFLVNMSHEIRTPMNAIIGLSDVALLKRQTPDNYDIFHKINTSSRNLLNIINDILDFSKIEAEKLELTNDEFLLEDIVANAFMVASERCLNKPIEMLLHIDEDVPLVLYGDKTRVWQILKNLLDNSAKYTAVGRITLDISVDDEKSDDETVSLNFDVSDTGYGMNEAQLEKLFVAFEQFHNNSKNVSSGTGLGMSIVKQLIEIMNGTITVTSTENVGTNMLVNIPFKRVENAKTISESINNEELAGNSVLIVDDDQYAIEIMEQLVALLGAVTNKSSNINDALDLVRKKAEKNVYYKVILIDYLIGNENGIDLARQIKEITGDKSKLILVTAYQKNLIDNEIKTSCFNDVIQKPFMPSMFLRQLTDTLNNKMSDKTKQYKQFRGANILICEDNAINQDVAIAIFDIFGITPTIADNGEIAMSMIEKTKFDIIFMDLLMPVMDGHTTTKNIRNLPDSNKNKNTPILAMTANIMPDIVAECISEGMQGCIGKPIDIDLLNEKLDEFLPRTVMRVLPENQVDDSELIQIKDIDMQEGVSRFGGKKDVYYKTLLKFASDDLISDEPYEEKILFENRGDFKMEIHSIKGVSGNLGIKHIYSLCKEFEEGILEQTATKEMYEEIVNELDITRNNIKIALADYIVNEEKNKEKGDAIEFFDIMDNLKMSLEDFDVSKSEDYVAMLDKKEWEGVNESDISKISEFISDYNFDGALSIVLTFLEGK